MCAILIGAVIGMVAAILAGALPAPGRKPRQFTQAERDEAARKRRQAERDAVWPD